MKKENIEIIRRESPDGATEEAVIYGLEDGEEQYYRILGTGYGVNFAHCFSMGHKNKENFWERVFAYKISLNREQADMIEKITGKHYISVEFYELS
ncbi:MAG: hypothetical protein RBS77_03820 [Candidatus Moranbacteria bacterium]|jgi:hypothetical protein|nr:hypothetical protein [Candidatus Moranbacteria bacterium]